MPSRLIVPVRSLKLLTYHETRRVAIHVTNQLSLVHHQQRLLHGIYTYEMADFRRRSVFQPMADQRSNLPVPSSSKKPQPTVRPSLGGPAGRVPLKTSQSNSGPGPNPRQSLFRSQNLNPALLASATKAPANFGRTPQSKCVRYIYFYRTCHELITRLLLPCSRRISTWGGGQVAATPGPSNSLQSGKDTRQLRDKNVQAKMRQEIVSYLQPFGFDVTSSTVAKLPAKDYRTIFSWLVSRLDPSFPFNDDIKFEDEIKTVLRSIRYPFMNGFDHKWVTAPGAMHASAPLLGLLHWLVEMCQVSVNSTTE